MTLFMLMTPLQAYQGWIGKKRGRYFRVAVLAAARFLAVGSLGRDLPNEPR